MREAPPTVHIESLSHRFGAGPWVLRDLELTVRPGEFVSFLSPSGGGKTTLLRLLAGLESPTEGTVRFSEDPAAARQDLAYIFQDPTLLPWLNARDNLALPLRLRGLDREGRHRRAEELGAMLGLGEALDRYPRELSGGMRMRVSLGRALATEPRLLLLDEPFGALDALTRQRLNEELLALHARDGWSAFFVTHSLTEAVFLSHRVVLMSGSPGRFLEVVDIPLPHPRTAETRTSPAYQQLMADLSGRLLHILAA